MKHALALVPVALFAVACTDADPSPTSSAPPPADGLALRVATPEHLAGHYAAPDTGLEVDFDVARTDDALFMHVTTGSGHVLIHAETHADTYEFEYLDGRLGLSVDKAWVEAVRAAPVDDPVAQSEAGVTWTGDLDVLDEMMAVPEVAALPWLSRTLGAQGFTGAAFPASLALHKVARESADGLGIEVPALDVEPDEAGYCARATANDCYGMCGYGCSCWSWVCGDCCYHSGCARHDSWCRNGQWYYCYNITAVIALFGC